MADKMTKQEHNTYLLGKLYRLTVDSLGGGTPEAIETAMNSASSMVADCHRKLAEAGQLKGVVERKMALYINAIRLTGPSATPEPMSDRLKSFWLSGYYKTSRDNEDEGELLRLARKSRDMSQEELGELLKYPKQTISNWENGRFPIPDNCRIILDEMFGLDFAARK